MYSSMEYCQSTYQGSELGTEFLPLPNSQIFGSYYDMESILIPLFGLPQKLLSQIGKAHGHAALRLPGQLKPQVNLPVKAT